MNEYQKALDRIKEFHKNFICTTTKDESWYIKYYDLDTLQELIDNYSKMEKALNEACIKLSNEHVPLTIEFANRFQWKEYLLNEANKCEKQ